MSHMAELAADVQSGVARFTNEEQGVAAEVVPRKDGQFAVRLIDLDADAVVPYIRIFKEEPDALMHARSLI